MNTKEKLLDSAEWLARSRGYDGFSYADLAADVGIRKASIHHHFPSKANLALVLVDRYRHRFLEALEKIEAENSRAGDRLTSYLDAYRSALSNGQTLCLCVAFSAGSNSLSDDVLEVLNAFDRMSVSWLQEVFLLGRQDRSIREVGLPTEEASACLAIVEGAQLLARAAKNPARFDSAVEILRRRAA